LSIHIEKKFDFDVNGSVACSGYTCFAIFDKTLTMKTIVLLLSVIITSSLFGQNVNIPDANFKAYLLGNSEINTNGDTEIQVSEASVFNGAIDCSNLFISDLTGIETFTSLTDLVCNENQLISLDVSQNIVLEGLSCGNNLITSLNLSMNTALYVLWCPENQLSCLNIKNGNNSNFWQFYVSDNPNLGCIEVDDAAWSSSNWTGIDFQASFSEDCNNDCSSSTVGINELSSSKNLIQILDLMGRETSFKPNTPLIYVYDDGGTEKVFSVEY